jgi:hypothetical protein
MADGFSLLWYVKNQKRFRCSDAFNHASKLLKLPLRHAKFVLSNSLGNLSAVTIANVVTI